MPPVRRRSPNAFPVLLLHPAGRTETPCYDAYQPKAGEQIEVDWAGDPAQITNPDTGEIIPAFLFVGVMTYSQYPYVEAFIDEKQRAWITAHVHMYEYFGGVTRILVPDNTKTAVIHNNDWYNQELNTIYHEMAEH